MKFIKAITLATIISLIFACSLKRESDYVATINGDKISVEDFLNNYRNFLNVTGIQDNLPSRKMILDNVINEKLILSEFEKNNMNTAVDFIETKNIIYEQLLLNHYCEKEILPKIAFSNKELFQFYIQENTFYHIKQVFASDLNKARQYYEQLNAGMSFEELAGREGVHAGKVDLGFIKLKDLNRRFRQEITGLKVGEISQPMRGRFGYTILRIEEKRTSPILTEYEFAKQSNILSEKLRLEYSDSLQHDYILKLKKEIKFLWIEDNLKFLFDILKKVKTKDDLPVNMETFISLNNPVCQMDGKDYYYKDLLPLILKSKTDQIRAVRDIDLLKDFITGLVIRERLIDKAKSIGIDQTPEFQQEYDRKLTELKLDYWVQCFQDTVQFRDSDYDAFYQANQAEFIIPVRRKVYEICIPDEQIAQGLKKRIENGEKFQQLATEFHQYNHKKSKDGFLGILTSADLGKFGTAVFSAPLNEVVGPLKYAQYYYLFLSTDEFESQPLSVDKAKALIEKKYRQDLSIQRMALHFKNLADKYNVRRNTDILKSIKYQNLIENMETMCQ